MIKCNFKSSSTASNGSFCLFLLGFLAERRKLKQAETWQKAEFASLLGFTNFKLCFDLLWYKERSEAQKAKLSNYRSVGFTILRYGWRQKHEIASKGISCDGSGVGSGCILVCASLWKFSGYVPLEGDHGRPPGFMGETLDSLERDTRSQISRRCTDGLKITSWHFGSTVVDLVVSNINHFSLCI